MDENKEIKEDLKKLESPNKTEKYSFENRDEYVKFLDKVLNKKHVQSRDIGNGKSSRYYSSVVQKAVADFVFQEWNVLDISPLPVSEKFITVRVKIAFIPSYPDATEEICSGVASILLNSTKNNLEYQLPASVSRAIGNALMNKGNIFGRNLSTKFNKNANVPDDFSIRKSHDNKKDTEKVPEQKAEKIPTPPPVINIDDEDLPF